MIDPLIKDQLDIELDKVVHDVNGRIYTQIEKLERLKRVEGSYTSTLAMRKAKKRERLNRAKGRR